MNPIQQLFTEKFRPSELGTLIVPDRIRAELSKGLIQNLLLYGGPGSGKTSTLKILSKGYPTLYINASSERGIDVLREKIGNFCATLSLEDGKDKLKCVILDEIDGATGEFFNAFKASMEKYSNVARFIASCNYIQKVPEAIQSRFNCISYDPIDKNEELFLIDQYKKRVGVILNAMKVDYTEENLEKFVKNDFPDMRSLMNKLQSFHTRQIKVLDGSFSINYDFEDLYKLCISPPDKPYENYKLISGEYSSRIDDALYSLGKDFIEFLKTNKPDYVKYIPLILIAVAEYQYQKSFVIDSLISLLACVYKIQTICKQ